MAENARRRVAILYPGDDEARQHAGHENTRFSKVFLALAALGMQVEPAVYHDDFSDEVHRQLLQVDGVLVWVNPIEGGRDRSVLDAMLREVAAAGVFVSAHPDVILKLGTKEVLYRTRDIGWGCDTHLYRSVEQLCRELPARLAAGGREEVHQDFDGGGLARPVGAEEREDAALRHSERQIAHGFGAPEAARELVGFDDVHGV